MTTNNTTSTYFFLLYFILILSSCTKDNDLITQDTQTPLTEDEISMIGFSIDTALVSYINEQANTFVWPKKNHVSVYCYLDSLVNTLPFPSGSAINIRVLDTPSDKSILIGVGGYIYINRGFLDLFENETALLGLINLLSHLSLSRVGIDAIVDSIGQSYINDLQIGANINNSPLLYRILSSIHYTPTTTHDILNNSYDHFCSIEHDPILIYNFLSHTTGLKDFINNFPYVTGQLAPLNKSCYTTSVLKQNNESFDQFKRALQ
jgi:hypothetical protein